MRPWLGSASWSIDDHFGSFGFWISSKGTAPLRRGSPSLPKEPPSFSSPPRDHHYYHHGDLCFSIPMSPSRRPPFHLMLHLSLMAVPILSLPYERLSLGGLKLQPAPSIHFLAAGMKQACLKISMKLAFKGLEAVSLRSGFQLHKVPVGPLLDYRPATSHGVPTWLCVRALSSSMRVPHPGPHSS